MAGPEQDGDAEPNNDVPVTGETVPDLLSSDQVFQRIVADADHEITSGLRELFFAAVAGGFAITITYLLYASMSAATDGPLLAVLLYPSGSSTSSSAATSCTRRTRSRRWR